MTPDEKVLRALLRGARSTVELVAATSLSERACRYRLHHLIATDYVWSPERGKYRLTGRGRVIAAEIVPDAESPVDGPGVLSG